MQVTQQQAGVSEPRKFDLRSWLNSPWPVLAAVLAAAVLVGGFWLVLHPEIITSNLDKPYALLAGPCLVGSVLVGWLVLRFFSAIERGCKAAWAAFLQARKDDGSGQFFWIVIIVFLAVSVFASGSFFSILERDAFIGLGYATALFIDLVAVQCMRARLNAVRMRDKGGAFLYLLGVLICAGASAFANVYTSLQTFTAPAAGSAAAGGLPGWMIGVAPWFGLVFPGLIVLLSMTADYTVDQSTGRLEPEKYRAQEEKRVKILEIQRDMLRTRVLVEREIEELTASLKHRKDGGRVFFLIGWLFPKQQVSIQPVLDDLAGLVQKHTELAGLVQKLQEIPQVQPVDAAALTSAIVERLEASYAAKFEAITEQLQVVQSGSAELVETEDTGASDTLIEDMRGLLIGYPGLVRWLESGQRSASTEEIIEVTGHTPKMIANRVKDTFAKTNRPGIFRLTSVVKWLKVAPLPRSKADTSGELQAVNPGANGHSKAAELDLVTG